MVDGELECEVERVKSHRFVGHGKLQFLVKRLGYGVEHNTWEPEVNCANCPEKVNFTCGKDSARQKDRSI
jgi:hypothetical protein